MVDDDARGREATRPTEVPAKGWVDILTRTAKEAKADRASLLAAGVAFFFLLALAPALSALTGVYGLVADPADAAQQVQDFLAAAPQEVQDMVQQQLETAAGREQGAALLSVLVGTVLALWAASAGVQHLVEAINVAYGEEETRGFVKLRGLALLLSVGAVVFLTITIGLIAFLPAALADTGLGDPARIALGVLRWPLLAVAMVAALGILYRLGGDRDDPRWRWVQVGSVAATVLWLIGSALFSVYASRFGSYDETYGALASVVVVMLWLFLTAYAIIFGAELNAETERQTRVDTTTGPHRPLGHRHAEAADTVGPTAQEVREGLPADADVSEGATRS
jgi:membrane protein